MLLFRICTFVFMSDQIFLLFDQNCAPVGHISFQGEKVICSPGGVKGVSKRCSGNVFLCVQTTPAEKKGILCFLPKIYEFPHGVDPNNGFKKQPGGREDSHIKQTGILERKTVKPWTGPARLYVRSYERSNQPKRQIKQAKSKTTTRQFHNATYLK